MQELHQLAIEGRAEARRLRSEQRREERAESRRLQYVRVRPERYRELLPSTRERQEQINTAHRIRDITRRLEPYLQERDEILYRQNLERQRAQHESYQRMNMGANPNYVYEPFEEPYRLPRRPFLEDPIVRMAQRDLEREGIDPYDLPELARRLMQIEPRRT